MFYFGPSGFAWALSGILTVVLWAAVGLGIAWLWHRYDVSKGRYGKGASRIPLDEDDKALAIARERYARGEISLEEFETIKHNLKK